MAVRCGSPRLRASLVLLSVPMLWAWAHRTYLRALVVIGAALATAAVAMTVVSSAKLATAAIVVAGLSVISVSRLGLAAVTALMVAPVVIAVIWPWGAVRRLARRDELAVRGVRRASYWRTPR